MAHKAPEGTSGIPPWAPVALLILAILCSRGLLDCMEESFGSKRLQFVLHHVVHISFVLSVLALSCLIYLGFRARRYGRAIASVLFASAAGTLFMAQPQPGGKFECILYFLLGMTLYHVRVGGCRNTGIRCYFDIFVALSVTVFLDGLVRGFLPTASFQYGLSHVHAMGMAGAFFARNLDTQRPYRFARTSRPVQHGGAAPLLDLHLFGRDLVLLLALAVLFLLQDGIVSFYRTARVAGDWRVQGAEGRLLRMTRDGRVLCRDGDAAWVPVRRWGIEGNLLDGFFLFMVPPRPLPDGRCSFLNPWVEARRRFRVRGEAVVFDQATPGWKWPVDTVLRRKPGEGAVLWERVR